MCGVKQIIYIIFVMD